MSNPIAVVDVRNLPFWPSMQDDVLAIVKAALSAPKGRAQEFSAAVLAGLILQHLEVFAALVGTQEATQAFENLLSLASPADYPQDDDTKLDPVDLEDPSTKWDNRKTTH